MPTRYIYHVAYVYSDTFSVNPGFGTSTSSMSREIDSPEQLNDIVKAIKDLRKCNNVVILNFILLRKE